MNWIVFAVFVFAATGLAIYTVGIYNGLIRLKHAIDRSWANIDVLLKQRHDELPKLIDTVKGYMVHERQLLEEITAARAGYERARGVQEKGEADQRVHHALERLFAVAENYPELKADSSFRMLQERISGIEEGIADRREFFNHSVNAFNVRIEQIPDVFVARFMGLTEPRELFEARAEERQDVQVAF